MSAIAGIVHFDGAPVAAACLDALARSSPGRGPDGRRSHADEGVGLLHLAFEITPESRAEAQPVTSADGRYTLVADVRLDNRDELAGLLDIEPDRRAALTDPDLLLLAFRAWGSRCAERLLGDFAFAVWDRRVQELFLARDQLGGFGLCYRRLDRSFAFASEVAALLDLTSPQPEINADAVAKTLAGMQLEPDETYFKSVAHLPPAHAMTVSATGVRRRRYWDVEPDFRISYRSEDDYTDRFLELMEQAVRCRLRSVHPVGISLSGGNDSTLLAALAARQLDDSGKRLHSFSYVFDRFAECDERRWIEPVVDRYRIEAHYVPADALLSFADLEERPVPKDFFWTNCYAQLPESIAAASAGAGCRLLLDGMFGDALFCEPSMFAADLIRQFRLLDLFGLLRAHRGAISLKRELLHHGVRQLLPRGLRQAYRSRRPVKPEIQFPFLTEHWHGRLLELQRQSQDRAETLALSPGRRTRYRRIFQPLWAQGFAATRNNPYNRSGIERCSPYFDRRLVEFVLAIPTEQLSHAGCPRRLQKNAMRRLLPEAVCRRREKTNFEPLLRDGLEHREVELLRAMSRDCLAVAQGWIRPDWPAEALGRAGGRGRDLYAVAQCIQLELWLRAVTAAQSAPSARWCEPSPPNFLP